MWLIMGSLFYRTSDTKSSAWFFLKNKKLTTGENHYKISKDLAMVESRVLDKDEDFNDITIKKGSWSENLRSFQTH